MLRTGDDHVTRMRHEVTRFALLYTVLHDAVAQRGAHAADEHRLVIFHDLHQLLDILKTAAHCSLVRQVVRVSLDPLHAALHIPALGEEPNFPKLAQVALIPIDHHRALGLVQGKVQPVG